MKDDQRHRKAQARKDLRRNAEAKKAHQRTVKANRDNKARREGRKR